MSLSTHLFQRNPTFSCLSDSSKYISSNRTQIVRSLHLQYIHSSFSSTKSANSIRHSFFSGQEEAARLKRKSKLIQEQDSGWHLSEDKTKKNVTRKVKKCFKRSFGTVSALDGNRFGGLGGGSIEKPQINVDNTKSGSQSRGKKTEEEGELEAWERAQSWEHFSGVEVVQGVATMVAVERATAVAGKAFGIPFPAPVLVLAAVGLLMALNNPTSLQLFEFNAGAVAFFDTWLPMFFVPSVAGIALAPATAGSDIIKGALILGGSYAFNLWGTARLSVAVEKYLELRGGDNGGVMSHEERLSRIGNAARVWSKVAMGEGAKALSSVGKSSSKGDLKQVTEAAARLLNDVAEKIKLPKRLAPDSPSLPKTSLLGGIALLLPLLLIPATRANSALMTPGFLLLTIGLFTYAKRLPPTVRKWLSPTVVAGTSIATLCALYGTLSLSSWRSGIQLYKDGAGAIFVMLIGPAVASLGYKVHTQRVLLEKSVLQLLLSCLVIVPSGLIVTALIGRILGASSVVTLSLVPATTTLGLAFEMGSLLEAHRGLIVAGVTIAGTVGISTARQLLAFWKVEGAVARGMAVGASSHTLGASAIAVDEPQAAAVAGLTLALKGTFSVFAITYPPFRNLLLTIARGY